MDTIIPLEDPGHDLDMVTLFSSMNHDAEMEALSIQSVLEGAGIEAVLVGPSTIPSVEFQVQVPRAQKDDAERVLAAAREAGPASADEAEKQTEL